ncbi:hypothetical protein Tco_1510003 [Tanacetum coccineum]
MSSSPIHDQKTEKTIVNGGDNVVGRRERPSRACTVRSAARLHAAAAAEAEVRKNKSKKRKVRREVVEEVEEEEEEPASPDNEFSKIVTVLVKEPPLAQMGQMARWNIRSMWELAAVLNFFNIDYAAIKAKNGFDAFLITENKEILVLKVLMEAHSELSMT